MQRENARALWERWQDIDKLRGRELEIHKKEWFVDAFLFVEKLPEGAHLWCAPDLQHVVWPLLEPLRFYGDGGLLPDLWKMISPLRGCLQCACQYNAAKCFYVQEFSPEVEPLLDVLRGLDRTRVIFPLRRALQKLEPMDRDELCLLFEILMYPEDFQDDQSRKVLMLVMRYAENTLALNPDIHPEIMEFFSSANAPQKLSQSLALFRSTGQKAILRGLTKLVKIFDETVCSTEASRNDGSETESDCVEILVDLGDTADKCVALQEATTNDECVKMVVASKGTTASDRHEKPEVADRKKRHVTLDGPSRKKQRLGDKDEEPLPEVYDRLASPAMLDEWHKRVLSLNLWRIPSEHSEELLEVPLAFESYEHYLQIFRPLCFEELKAHLERSLETVDLSRSDVVTAFSLRQEGYFHLVEFEGHTVALAENDLILLRDPARVSHMVGKVEKRNSLLVKVYLPDSCGRLSKLREMLVTGSAWQLNKLMCVTTFIREQQAISAMHSFPLLETILSASPPPGKSSTRSLPEHLRSKLRREYNESQLSAIDAVGDRMISLIQGPPGTGKTRTILGIVSALLAHANEEVGKAKEQELLDLLRDGNHTERREKDLKATRILVCAQSNAAVDELVIRISDHGVYNYDGGTYCPSIVRVGDTKRVHPQAMAVHIDRLVARNMAENAGIRNARSPQELRSKLDEVLSDMQALAAPSDLESQDGISKLEKLAGLQEKQRQLLTELIKVEDREHGFLTGSNRKKKQAMKLQVLREADVVLTTLSGCGGHIYSTLVESVARKDALATEMLFDAVIIDEAAQAVEPSTLIPLQLLKATHGKCILIGDPKQLPATVHSAPATRLLFDCSMFERFQQNGYPVSILTTQYRMHPEIRSFPSTHFYGGQLKDGISHDKRSAPFHQERCFGPYRFFDIRDGQERPGSMQSLTNPDEAEFICQLLRVLKERYPEEVRPGKIGVITPYQEQRKVLQESMRSLHSGIDVNTVDSFQGREADIIVLSTVRASYGHSQAGGGGIGFLSDVRRMNVALTRAKFSLWVVGNARTLERNPDWKALLLDCRRRGLVSSVRKPYHSAIYGFS